MPLPIWRVPRIFSGFPDARYASSVGGSLTVAWMPVTYVRVSSLTRPRKVPFISIGKVGNSRL